MGKISATNVREFIVSYLSQKVESTGRAIDSDAPDDYDLLKDGGVDSLGMFDLTVALEEYFGQQIDFEGLDPEEMAFMGPLCQHVAKMLNQEG